MFTTSIILRPLLGLKQESSTGQDSRFCFHAVTAAFASGQPGPPLQLLRRTSSQRLSPCRSEGGCHIGREASAQSASCGFKEASKSRSRNIKKHLRSATYILQLIQTEATSHRENPPTTQVARNPTPTLHGWPSGSFFAPSSRRGTSLGHGNRACPGWCDRSIRSRMPT